MAAFRQIGVISRADSISAAETLGRLLDCFLSRKRTVFLEQSIVHMVSGSGFHVCTREQMGPVCDLVVVVGGDGSLLGAARDFVPHGVPVLGVNRGCLGFLADIQPACLEQQIGEVLQGKYRVEQRFLLEAAVTQEAVHSDGSVVRQAALNEIVLHPGQATRMIEFELFINEEFVYSQRSDGLIVSTPTGSTAYALSAGGPIMHPGLDALVLVPMFPHTLSSRPVVVDGNSRITLVIGRRSHACPQLSCDGRAPVRLKPGDSVSVEKKSDRLQLVHPLDYNYYASCRTKLGWGNRLDSVEP
ncbi:MAG: NAD(+) kinase [Kistimonas sp.]|nr:NAD(+) kinase [Kistimonas sp.]